MIVYSLRCINCSDRKRWKEIRAFTQSHNLEIGEIRINRDSATRDIAMNISEDANVTIPFIEHNGKYISLNDNLEKLL